jgi:hypothetical protein
MNTLATREQSEAIRKQMRSIRCDLPYAIDDARDDLQQLTDWKYYVRQLPLASVTAAFAIGYLIVPEKSHPEVTVSDPPRWLHRLPARHKSVDADEPEQASLVGGLLGAAAATALRTGVSLAMREVGRSVMQSRSPQLASPPSHTDSQGH